MKTKLAVALFAAGAMSASGNIILNWGNAGGVSLLDDSPLLSQSGMGLAQLIYHPTSMTPSVALPGGEVETGYMVVDTFQITAMGGSSDFGGGWNTTYNDQGTLEIGGYVYGRIFENVEPGPGTALYNGAPQVTVDNPGPPAAPDVYGIISPPSLQVVNATVVPEPMSLALIAVGIGAIAYRRRRDV